jgi:hypothetical protein
MAGTGETGKLITLTEAQILTTPEGAAALRLGTKEQGSLVFLIDLETIAILQRELAAAEGFLRQSAGKA